MSGVSFVQSKKKNKGVLVGERLGLWHTREQLGEATDPKKDDLIEVMEQDRQLTQPELTKFLQ